MRSALRAAGYDAGAVERSRQLASSLRAYDLRTTVEWLELAERGDEQLAVLLTVFSASGTVTAARLAGIGVDVDGLAELDVIRRSGEDVTGTVRIDEIGGMLVMSDRESGPADYVAAVSPSTRLAAAFTAHVEVERVLDVGTGSGAHALIASPRAEEVIATDFNPRALALTRMNAALNGLTNIETREGSFFEPVDNERFGLIVINPPYVISPDGGFMYRDAGYEGDGLSRTLLRELPHYLEEGGWATLQGNWAHNTNAPWHRPLGECLEGSGCDAFIARISSETPLSYAARWAEPDHLGDPDGYRDRIQQWVDYYRRSGIERITGAMVVLRKRSGGGANWRRASTIQGVPEGLGPRLPRLADAQDRLAEDEDLSGARLRPAAGLDLDRFQRPDERPRCVAELMSTPTTRRHVSPEAAQLLLSLDGSRPLGKLDDALAAEVVKLVKTGFLEFAD